MKQTLTMSLCAAFLMMAISSPKFAADASRAATANHSSVSGTTLPEDPLFVSNQDEQKLIGMPQAWGYTIGTPSVLVAILDGGIDLHHFELSGQWTYATPSPSQHVFVSSPDLRCANPATPEDDAWMVGLDAGTGTHVAGTIAARSTLGGAQAEGIAGVAPGSRLLPVKVFDCTGHGSVADTADAISFAAQAGARVIYVGATFENSAGCAPALQFAISSAVTDGAVVVAPAGDRGTGQLYYPAGCSNVIGVGASSRQDGHLSISQQNASIDIVAPGESIWSTTREVSGNHGFRSATGTAMAAAHVAGCAALMKSISPTLTPSHIQSLLENTAVDLGMPGRDTAFGAGRLQCGASVEAAIGPPQTRTSTAASSPTRTATRTLSPMPTIVATSSPSAIPVATPRPGMERIEDNSGLIVYSEGWSEVSDPSASAGHYQRSIVPGSTATLQFNRPAGVVVWHSIRGPDRGSADVSLDGVFMESVDLFSPSIEYGFVRSYQTVSGSHSLRISVRSDEHPPSIGRVVVVDAFDVMAPPTATPTTSCSFEFGCRPVAFSPTSTPTSSQTPAPSGAIPSATPPAGLKGRIRLEGRESLPPSIAVQVAIFSTSGNMLERMDHVANGIGEFPIPIPATGTYHVEVKYPLNLSLRREHLSSGTGVGPVDFGIARAGDADGSDAVTAGDFSILKASFGTAATCALNQSAVLPCADFDGSGFITPNDFSLLKSNFGHHGPNTM
jgi:subtilisin family serine protease